MVPSGVGNSIDKNIIKKNYENRQQDLHIPKKSVGKKATSMFDVASCGGIVVSTSPPTGIHAKTAYVSNQDASPFRVLKTIQNKF